MALQTSTLRKGTTLQACTQHIKTLHITTQSQYTTYEDTAPLWPDRAPGVPHSLCRFPVSIDTHHVSLAPPEPLNSSMQPLRLDIKPVDSV